MKQADRLQDAIITLTVALDALTRGSSEPKRSALFLAQDRYDQAAQEFFKVYERALQSAAVEEICPASQFSTQYRTEYRRAMLQRSAASYRPSGDCD